MKTKISEGTADQALIALYDLRDKYKKYRDEETGENREHWEKRLREIEAAIKEIRGK